ncbi:uncharacterized protein TNCT_323391 [Trichonephila clavata]|uniref:DUF7041 domain-containing protein n=1 Tax=Trichonephila clavata TaxID=2740835 RepID=A0A8X6HH87_TRICU|nr:uncharacterized protein TNCT_323391 [Trichonephila clavata]
MQIEVQNSKIAANQSKYDIIISTTEAEILSQISDIAINLPANDKYDTIKNRLISVFADRKTQRTQKLLTDLELGGKKLFQLLYEMRNLSDEKVSEQFLKTLWLQRLPFNMRSNLFVYDDD